MLNLAHHTPLWAAVPAFEQDSPMLPTFGDMVHSLTGVAVIALLALIPVYFWWLAFRLEKELHGPRATLLWTAVSLLSGVGLVLWWAVRWPEFQRLRASSPSTQHSRSALHTH